MKIQSLFLIALLVITSMLSACYPTDSTPESALQPTLPSPDPTNTSVPTLESTALPAPTIEPTPFPIPTLPPADITITVEGVSGCSYKGPQPIPAAESLTMNWYINSTEADWYGLLVTIVEEGHTKQDLIREMTNAFPPPPWTVFVGDFEAPSGSSMQGTLQASSGPLRGPLYFACWKGSDAFSLKPFATLGPFEVQ